MLNFVFDLPSTSLIVVTTEDDIQRMKISLTKATLIGIDTETKPTFVPKHQLVGGPNLTALIQIAVRCPKSIEEVFLVDMLHISKNSRLLNVLDSALQQGLLENQCFKLGQGLTNDLRELAQSYPTVKAFRLTSCVLETHDLMKYLKPVLTNPISLKNLVKEFLHLNLSKSQQMSNWAKRPLTREQLHYAACDALVLLRLYDAIYCEIEDKLSVAGDSSSAESDFAVSDTASETVEGGDNESSRSASPTTSATSTNATVKETLMSLSRTVDYIGKDFTRNDSNNKGKGQKGLYGHKQDTAMRFPESSLLNNSLLRGWQSQSAKQWLKQQTSTAPSAASTSTSHASNSGPGKRSAESSPREQHNKRPRRNSFGSNSGSARHAADEEEDVRIPLPKGTGRHVIFTPPSV